MSKNPTPVTIGGVMFGIVATPAPMAIIKNPSNPTPRPTNLVIMSNIIINPVDLGKFQVT